MSESFETKFREELYKKFDICKRVLIPKEAYYTMIEDLKTAAKPGGSKKQTRVLSLIKVSIKKSLWTKIF